MTRAPGTTVQAGGDAPTTDPTRLFDLAEGMHAIEALTASVCWLHLFEWLAEHRATEHQICGALELSPRPARVLLTLLVALGLVCVDRSGIYDITPLAREHLLRTSPWSLAACFDALKDRPTCVSMLSVLRTGKPMGAQELDDGTPLPWSTGMNEESFAEFFLNAIDSRNAYLAHGVAGQLDLSRSRHVLDIGGGSGLYACALVRCNSGLHATVLEKPPVDAVARRAVERRGLGRRVSVTSGDMLADPLPTGHDVHLYSNVIHDWGETKVRRLLDSSFNALPIGGRIVVHDAMLSEDQTDQLAVAQYSVLLMSFTAGRCYSVTEVKALLKRAGFVDVAHYPTVVHRSLIIGWKPGESAR